MNQPFGQHSPPAVPQHERSFSQGPSMQQFGAMPGGGPPRGPGHGASYGSGSISASGPPQLSTLPFQNSQPPPQQNFQQPPQAAPAPTPYSQPPSTLHVVNLPPLKPVFGLSLEQLFERDGSAVPMVVYQCIQAVDLFGLEVEGIYRLSGTSSHVNKIKAMFDNGKSPRFTTQTQAELTSAQMPRRWTFAILQTSSTMSTVLLVYLSSFSVICPTPY